MKKVTKVKKGSKGPSEPESPYSLGQKVSMRSLHFAGFSNKQIVAIMNDGVTASAIGTAVREGGNYSVLLGSEIAAISEQVGEPRGQLS